MLNIVCWSLRWWFWLVCSSLCNILLQKKKKSLIIVCVFLSKRGYYKCSNSFLWRAHSTDACIQGSLAIRLWAWGWRLSFPPPCRKMWIICSSGWRRLWPPLRGSLMCSLWSLGSEYTLKSFACLNRDAIMTHDITIISKPLPPPAASHPLCFHVSSCHLGWRIVPLMCPCSPGRCWYSSAPSCGIAQCTFPSETTVGAPPTPFSSSSSSS